MNRLLTLTLIVIFSACGQQTEKEKSIITNSVQQPTDSSTTENVKNQTQTSETTDTKKKSEQIEMQFSNGPSHEKLKLTEETVTVIQMDSLEIEQLKRIASEDIFYTAAADLMWYNSMMLEKMDSLGVSVKYTNKDTVDFFFNDYKRRIVKDSTFSLYTYFHFDGKEIKKTELFELIED